MDVLVDISLTSDQRGWVALGVALLAVGYLFFRPKLKRKIRSRKHRFPGWPSSAMSSGRCRICWSSFRKCAADDAQIDTCAAKLEQLINEADQRIAAPGQSPAAGAVTGDPLPADSPAPLPPPVPPIFPPAEIDPRHVEIYSLADRGAGAKEIATQLNRPSGEVELILALRPRMQ